LCDLWYHTCRTHTRVLWERCTSQALGTWIKVTITTQLGQLDFRHMPAVPFQPDEFWRILIILTVARLTAMLGWTRMSRINLYLMNLSRRSRIKLKPGAMAWYEECQNL
jgi:hypothetical protein